MSTVSHWKFNLATVYRYRFRLTARLTKFQVTFCPGRVFSWSWPRHTDVTCNWTLKCIYISRCRLVSPSHSGQVAAAVTGIICPKAWHRLTATLCRYCVQVSLNAGVAVLLVLCPVSCGSWLGGVNRKSMAVQMERMMYAVNVCQVEKLYTPSSYIDSGAKGKQCCCISICNWKLRPGSFNMVRHCLHTFAPINND